MTPIKKEQDIILFVNDIPDNMPDELQTFRKDLANYGKKHNKKFRLAIIRDTRRIEIGGAEEKVYPDDIIYLSCDFSDPIKIQKALLPYQKELLGVTCRSEINIDSFSKLVPNVPYLKTPTSESLDWSIQKTMMRKRFNAYDKKITPKFYIVKELSRETMQAIKEKVGFPLVVKPSGLASSLMVSPCYYEEELEKTLKEAFKKIRKIYKENDRKKDPQLLVEQFMEGEMFSIDGYVTSKGKVYFCPLVKVKTGKQIGFDDFFGYQRIIPAKVEKNSSEKAQEVARKGVHALGLRCVSVHIELMRTEEGWKIIEIGPRVGGYRHLMYQLSYGINHAVNDVLIRISQKPIIPKKIKGHTAVFLLYAKKEGKLKAIKGVKKVQELESFYYLHIARKIGESCKFAKNGGKFVCNLVLFNKDRSKLLADIRRMEKTLKIVT
ncbi:MAG: ATP-grasp domain-containing protein [Candidatus Pacebacteria bacterium]|nr:ATP-grasp domain-containing protein [Candidatus Paceibacterota bacterium]MDD3919017.1 ATP-grasp domain-containing protein [Candidatus Paceibacterota bacterium]